MIGIIGGSSFLNSETLKYYHKYTSENDFGKVILYKSFDSNIIFCQRHASDPNNEYSPPHLINTKAICLALKLNGCEYVIAFGSTGSLKPKEYPVGTLLMPNDYLNYSRIDTFYKYSHDGHRTPQLLNNYRTKVLEFLRSQNFNVKDNGIYIQTAGPRFETPAEVKLLSSFGDIVGMTCAREATLCNEIDLPYTLICMVDNLGNGLTAEDFSIETFKAGVRNNQNLMDNVLQTVINGLGTKIKNHGTFVDTIINASYILTMEEPYDILTNYSIVIDNGCILDILPTDDCAERYFSKDLVELKDHVLLPGLINCHTHTGMSMLRGYADDLNLIEWLTQHMWPTEGKFVNNEFVSDGTELGIAEMILAGTTTMNDMYFFPKSTIDVVDRTGFRAAIGLVVLDFPSNYARDADEYFEKGLLVYKEYSHHPRIQFTWAPHAPYTVSDENLLKAMKLCKETNIPFHTHLHETREEVEHSIQGVPDSLACHRSENRCSPVDNFNKLELLNSSLVAVHMTQLNNNHIDIIADTHTNVVHCPTSNLKLAAGFCRVGDLLEKGVNVALGTDSCASNNSLDMFYEVKTAAIVAKGVRNDPTVVPAIDALKMATINGAKALGLSDKIGSLKLGKRADIIAVKLNTLQLAPMYNVISHLVYSCSSHDVQYVWIDGKCVLKNRNLTTINAENLLDRCRKWKNKLHDFAEKELRKTEK